MHRYLGLAFALLAIAASPALAQDTLGVLTLYSADGKATSTMSLTSLFYPLQPPGTPPPADDKDQAHTVTVTAQVHAPDRAFVTWMRGTDTKRRVTMHVQDGEGADGSTYELENARLTGFSVGYSGGGGNTGGATLTIVPDHLSVNGFQLF